MELISPTEFAKETVQTVEDYSLLAGQSIANLFRHPRYFADMLQQADLIGVGSLPIVVLDWILHRGGFGFEQFYDAATIWLAFPARPIGFGWHGSRVRSGVDRSNGGREKFIGNGE